MYECIYLTSPHRYEIHDKIVLETAETKQADSQLPFALKIIEFHLQVFENELIEDAMLVPKKTKN